MVNAVLRKAAVAASRSLSFRTRRQSRSRWPRLIPRGWSSAGARFMAWKRARHLPPRPSQPRMTCACEMPTSKQNCARPESSLNPGELLSRRAHGSFRRCYGDGGFREGRVRLQDEGSQLIGELACSCTALDQNQEKILDACAAPGGKTLILAERNPAGAHRGLRIQPAAAGRVAQAPCRIRRSRGVPACRRSRAR